jgi:hypothetical protein
MQYEVQMAPLTPPTAQDAFEHSFVFFHHQFRPSLPEKKLRSLEALHEVCSTTLTSQLSISRA